MAAVLPRVGPRPLISLGLMLGAIGLVLLTQLDVNSTYAAHVLPSLQSQAAEAFDALFSTTSD